MSKRTDLHCPSRLIPSDYEHVLVFAHAGTDNGWPVPAWNVDVLTEMRKTLPFFRHNTSNCHVCGATFRFGDVFVHVPTGEHIIVGWECAEKISALIDHSEAMREIGKIRDAALQNGRRAMKKAKAEALLAGNEGLSDDLSLDHPILADLKDKLFRFGDLSDAQIALARKIAAEQRAPKKAAAQVPQTNERVMVTGRVVSLKVVEGSYRDTLKMLVEVDTEDGAYRLFGSVPSAINPNRGDVVEFVAAIERSQRDASFGFFSRPAKAKIVAKAEV